MMLSTVCNDPADSPRQGCQQLAMASATACNDAYGNLLRQRPQRLKRRQIYEKYRSLSIQRSFQRVFLCIFFTFFSFLFALRKDYHIFAAAKRRFS